jgi:chromate reductase
MPDASSPLTALGICGSLRRGSFNAALLRALPALAPQDLTIEMAAGIGELPLYNADIQNEQGFPAPVEALGERIRAADGIVIVTPEYNYSIPGVLKNAIDWVSRLPDQPFKNKPVLLQSAAIGVLGGARAQYHLRQTMVFLDAIVFTRPEVFVTFAKTKIDEQSGELTDEPTRAVIRMQLAAFAGFIRRISPETRA